MRAIIRLFLFCQILLVLPSACGVGDWSDEDAKFLAAAPERKNLLVSPPKSDNDTASLFSDRAFNSRSNSLQSQDNKFQNVIDAALNTNRLVEKLTTGLDLVHSLTPSKRQENSRIWGPYDDENHPGFEFQIAMARNAASFSYSVEWRRKIPSEPFSTLISGEFNGNKAKNGSGKLSLDFEKARLIGIADPNPLATVDLIMLSLSYDTASSAHLLAEMENGKKTGYQYAIREDGSGTISFESEDENFSGTRYYEYTARWLSNKSGRVDIIATQNSARIGNLIECWDNSANLVYHYQDFACTVISEQCNFGNQTNCSISQ